MNNTNNLQSNNSQSKIAYPPIIFSFAGKDYTVEELFIFFSTDFLDLIYQTNVFPPESPFAAIRFSTPTLNLLINVNPSFTQNKIFYCHNCPTLGQQLTSQLRPLIKNPLLTQVVPPSQNHQIVHEVTLPNNPSPHPTGHSPHFTPQSIVLSPPMKVKRKYTKSNHNNNK